MIRKDHYMAGMVWGLALVLVLAGVTLSVQSLRLFRKGEEAFRQKSREYARLCEMELDLRKVEAARNLFEALPRRKPVALEAMLKSEFPNLTPADMRTAREDVGEDWLAWEREVTFHDAPVGEVMGMIERAELQRPPWRLVKFTVRASSRGPGIGTVTLTLGALEKKE